MALLEMEDKRLSLQTELDCEKSQLDRNRMGQFATPSILAYDLLCYAKKILSKDDDVRFLDPAFGTGAFYAALLKAFPEHRIAMANAFEIDPHYAKPAKALWKETNLSVSFEDFTTANPKALANLVICNPPYVRHHHIVNGQKQRLLDASENASGERLSGLAGLYCHFLLQSHAWMQDGALAGWLIPSEFMDVNYGREVKNYLLNKTTLLHIHRFDPDDVQFDDALVSSAIVWFRKSPPPKNHKVKFTYGGTLSKAKLQRKIPVTVLRDEHKWTRFPAQDARLVSTDPTISDFFSIRRGLATGHNKFFILSEEEISKRGLTLDLFRPILPSPRNLKNDEIDSTDQGFPLTEKKLFLLDCSLSESEIRSTKPALWSYLEEGRADGVSEGYLCRHRSPWYSQEKRLPSPFLCTYLGRNGTSRGRPFRFLLNHSQAAATNVYLLLYPQPALADLLEKEPEKKREIWKVLNRITPEALLGEGRVYGGGLHKLEPKELGKVTVPEIDKIISLSVVAQ